MLRRGVIALLALLPILCLAQGPASADKLVVFKNGKAMKVKSVTQDGKWVKCEFEDKNFLSVPASGIQSIEEAALGSSAGDLRPTQVAAGSGPSGYTPGPGGLGGGASAVPPEGAGGDDAAQAQADIQAAMAEEQAARKQGAGQPGVTGFGRRGQRIGGQPLNNPFQPGGLRPLTQQASPFQNRSLTQRGNSGPIQAVPGGVLRPTNQNQPGNSEN